jgi:O-acetyl-ADP-ribose deacetylase (regulator of RNase III)
MPVEYRTGDLFEQGLPALAHGVNCRGGMGGIAGVFAAKWPRMRDEYQAVCSIGALQPGDVLPWTAPDGTLVYNCATQLEPGADARLDAIQDSLAAAVHDAEARGIDQIGMPRIGAGIGGLQWPEVQEAVEQVGALTPATLVVVSLPQ